MKLSTEQKILHLKLLTLGRIFSLPAGQGCYLIVLKMHLRKGNVCVGLLKAFDIYSFFVQVLAMHFNKKLIFTRQYIFH